MSTARHWLGITLLIVALAILLISEPARTLRAARMAETTTVAATANANQSPQFTSIDMLNAKDGWATAAFDNAAENPQPEFILRTTDGGRTWIESTPPGFPGNMQGYTQPLILFLDTNHAWVSAGATLWRTSDGGKSWTTISTGFGGFGSMMYPDGQLLDFIDPLHGWLLVRDCCAAGKEGAELYQTLDGGSSWKKISDVAELGGTIGGLPSSYHTSVTFENQFEGWMTLSVVDTESYLASTRDGGKSWTPSSIPMPPGQTMGDNYSVAGCDFEEPEVFKAGSVAINLFCREDSGAQDAPIRTKVYLYSTNDDGVTWQVHPLDSELDIFGLAMFNPKFGWGVALDPNDFANAYLVETLDGGKTLTTVERLPDALIIKGQNVTTEILDMIDPNTGWAVDSTNDLQFTADAGKTWTPLHAQIIPAF